MPLAQSQPTRRTVWDHPLRHIAVASTVIVGPTSTVVGCAKRMGVAVRRGCVKEGTARCQWAHTHGHMDCAE